MKILFLYGDVMEVNNGTLYLQTVPLTNEFFTDILQNDNGLPKLHVILNLFTFLLSRYSSVGVVTCLWRLQLRDLEQVLGKGKRFMYPSRRPGRPWDQPIDFCSMG